MNKKPNREPAALTEPRVKKVMDPVIKEPVIHVPLVNWSLRGIDSNSALVEISTGKKGQELDDLKRNDVELSIAKALKKQGEKHLPGYDIAVSMARESNSIMIQFKALRLICQATFSDDYITIDIGSNLVAYYGYEETLCKHGIINCYHCSDTMDFYPDHCFVVRHRSNVIFSATPEELQMNSCLDLYHGKASDFFLSMALGLSLFMNSPVSRKYL